MSKDDFLRFAYLPLVGDLNTHPEKLSGNELESFQRFTARLQDYIKAPLVRVEDGEEIRAYWQRKT